MVAQLNQARGEFEEGKNQTVVSEIEKECEEAGEFEDCEWHEGNEESVEVSEDNCSREELEQDLLPQPSGILIVPPTKSKWAVFLDD